MQNVHNTVAAKAAVKALVKSVNAQNKALKKLAASAISNSVARNKAHSSYAKAQAAQAFYSAQLKYNNYACTFAQMQAFAATRSKCVSLHIYSACCYNKSIFAAYCSTASTL